MKFQTARTSTASFDVIMSENSEDVSASRFVKAGLSSTSK